MSIPPKLDALLQYQDLWAEKEYAIAMGGLMCCFIAYHWVSKAYFRYGPRRPSAFVGKYLEIRRAGRRFLNHIVLGARLDKWFIYLLYWAINCIMLFTNPCWELIGKRFGWITVANLTLLVLLSLRNTPLAPLSGNSYEKLRPLHKIAGYTTIVCALIHGLRYVIAYHELGMIDQFRQPENFAGPIAGTSMLIMGISTIGWFVRRNYELFYIIHVTFFMLVIIAVGLHRRDWADHTIKITITIACLWFTDRLLRFGKKAWNFYGNYATLTPMADGAVRVRLQRDLPCRPGSHAFLWIPSVRFMETHPFTLVNNSPAEFLVREYDGFTRALVKAGREKPRQPLRCSVDGGYGQVPNFMNFDKVVLVAGGSGATFTFAIAMSMVKECAAMNVSKTIDFIWVVRYADSLNWFTKELQELQQSSNVNLMIYVTRDDTVSEAASSFETVQGTDGEKGVSTASSLIGDVEKGKEEKTPASPLSDFRKGRPDIAHLVFDCVSRSSLEERIGVGACGPSNLTESTREAVSRKDFDKGPSITFHSEEFEW